MKTTMTPLQITEINSQEIKCNATTEQMPENRFQYRDRDVREKNKRERERERFPYTNLQ